MLEFGQPGWSLTPGPVSTDEFWFSDGSLADKPKLADPGLMPLPDTASGLDWSHLVSAARAFEGRVGCWFISLLATRGAVGDALENHSTGSVSQCF